MAVSTILVIEDYSDTRELLSTLLRSRGYHVIEAENGVEGLMKASAKHPDLIILDLALPKMDGVETARRIHRMPKLSQTPIFVISAYLTEDVESEVRAVGCIETFGKPFDTDEFLKKLRAALSAGR